MTAGVVQTEQLTHVKYVEKGPTHSLLFMKILSVVFPVGNLVPNGVYRQDREESQMLVWSLV